jgi:hypothetical protein
MLRKVSPLFAAVLVLALVVPAQASEHVVTRADVSARLAQAAAARQTDLADLDQFLGSPLGRQSAALLGATTPSLQARLAHLSDAEAADLAGRARALRGDLTLGYGSDDFIVTLVILAVGTVALLLMLRQKEEPRTIVF